MNIRKYHRLVGIVMLTPLIAWTLTGLFFLIQPGYGAAYEMLQPRTYSLTGTLESPLSSPQAMPATDSWSEFRYLRTVLGDHLLVRTEQGWQHLHPDTLQSWPLPDADTQLTLVADAVARNPQRYGQVQPLQDGTFQTSTGARITLDWNTLSLRQSGQDTRWIDRLYQIHYLQWTGIEMLDRILGVLGLFLLAAMSVTGFRLSFKRQSGSEPACSRLI
ncbi:MAG: PepSY-associated TM helix domain-containing protein [Gammaproteobacteria bacterium]|nr:PepSY-associated TM helix domain-containing protein [Gammaproteobacteria bacterium]